MTPFTFFSRSESVDAWDSLFRWRDDSGLRDRTVDATWQRVANAVAASEGVGAAMWAQRFCDAFGQWRLLPDERLLRAAGTPAAIDDFEPLHAALNLAEFVAAPSSSRARLELDRIADTAALAVRLLDDALLALFPDGEARGEMRVGVIGMGDALNLLAVPYDSPDALGRARETATALARGTLRGAIELARERGAGNADAAALADRWRARAMPAELIDDGVRWGVRHARLTAIEPRPQLALLANCASDAIDPAWRNAHRAEHRPPVDPLYTFENDSDNPSLLAQIRLRAAMQPWIDLPIAYPLIACAEPSPEEVAALPALSEQNGLPPLRFRHVDAPLSERRDQHRP